MGRAFEFRRARKEKRWDKMSKAFTKLGKEIAISVKLSGPDPASNPRLRMAIQNAKGVNMPKDRIESAIKRASQKDAADFNEVNYEGYGPYGVAIFVECASDNTTRTVANVRHIFTKNSGVMGTSGSLDFMFTRKGVFKIEPSDINLEELELDLIDFGAEDIQTEEDGIYIYTQFSDFGAMQKTLEERGINVINAELQRIPSSTVDLTDEQIEEIMDFVEKLEEDDDVQAVYHTLK